MNGSKNNFIFNLEQQASPSKVESSSEKSCEDLKNSKNYENSSVVQQQPQAASYVLESNYLQLHLKPDISPSKFHLDFFSIILLFSFSFSNKRQSNHTKSIAINTHKWFVASVQSAKTTNNK